MKTIIAGALLSAFVLNAASAREIAPPPPLVDYGEASYVGLSYVFMCAKSRTYTVVISSPYGEGPQVSSLALRDRLAGPDELARINDKLAILKSLSTVTVKCLTGDDLILVEGYPRVAEGDRVRRVTVHITNAGVTVD